MSTNTTSASAKDEDTSLIWIGALADQLTLVFGLKPEEATERARRVVVGLRHAGWGGQHHYLPAPSKAERDAAIYRDFKGLNASEICRRYGIGRRHLYRIIAEQAALAALGSDISA